MKIGSFLFFVFLTPIAFCFAQIQITEIMYNPQGSDTNREWFEVVNSGSPIEIKTGRDGWRISDGKNHYLQTQGAIWNSNQVIVFVQDQNKFLQDYPSFTNQLIESSFTLKNSGGVIQILDEKKNSLSEVNYQDIASEGSSIIYNNRQWIQGNLKGAPGIYPDSVENFNNQILNSKQTIISDSLNNPLPTTSPKSSTTSQPQISAPQIITPVLFINEFLPSLSGKDENEFIELLNASGTVVNLSDYSIKVGDKKIQLIGESTSQYIILWKKNYEFSLKNKGETLILSYKDKEIHKIGYIGKAPEDESFSKINNKWVWTKPTPGKENMLIQNQKSNIKNQNELNVNNDASNTVFQEAFPVEFAGNIAESAKSTNNSTNTFNPIILGAFIAVILATVAVLILK